MTLFAPRMKSLSVRPSCVEAGIPYLRVEEQELDAELELGRSL